MNVLIVDDHPMMVEYLSGAVAKAFPGSTLRTANDLAAALRAARERAMDLVLLDLELPGYTGLASLLRFRREIPDARIVVISTLDGDAVIRGAHAAGAAGYVPKSTKPMVVMDVLRLVADGGSYFPPEALAGKPLESPETRLTPREREVRDLLLKGHTVEQIAHLLVIALPTAKHHTHAVYAAFGVSSRADLILAAGRRGVA